MKLAALCCTFRRPHTLGQLVESFLRQDYPAELRELVILDDAGQYENQSGDGWRLVSIPARFRSLGEKRNACAALASPDVDGFLVADDDDIYLPHWFRATADALSQADWSRPGLVLLEDGDGLREVESEGLYHGGWAFRKDAFYRVRGYGPHNNGEDQELAGRLHEAGVTVHDPCEHHEPFYIYRYDNSSYHLSYMDDAGYRSLGDGSVTKTQVQPGWFRDFASLPVRRRFVFAPHVDNGSDQQRVELIGPVDGPGGDGPSNGMYALQKELRKRIDDGTRLAHVSSRFPQAAMRSPGSGTGPIVATPPGGIRKACRSCKVRTCCSSIRDHHGSTRRNVRCLMPPTAGRCSATRAWYADLIRKHRGPANQSEIILWPYPIDPWPGEPLPDAYDLLIYAKNGHRPQLLEHLAEVFPRHIQIHYGQYRREELFEAARRSRACAYLADDDHGPLALQEILLAGCPTVGVRTGASFVRTGETGVVVDRLPPGRQCAESDDDVRALAVFMEAIEQAQALDRHSVRDRAAERVRHRPDCGQHHHRCEHRPIGRRH